MSDVPGPAVIYAIVVCFVAITISLVAMLHMLQRRPTRDEVDGLIRQNAQLCTWSEGHTGPCNGLPRELRCGKDGGSPMTRR